MSCQDSDFNTISLVVSKGKKRKTGREIGCVVNLVSLILRLGTLPVGLLKALLLARPEASIEIILKARKLIHFIYFLPVPTQLLKILLECIR